MTSGGKQNIDSGYAAMKGPPDDHVKALLPLSLLLLSGCIGAVSDDPSQQSVAQTKPPSGGGSSGSGGSSGGGGNSPPTTSGPVVPVNPAGIWDIANTVYGHAVAEVALIGNGKYFA